MLSGIRCSLTYLILPFLLPLMGVTTGLDPLIGLALGTIAIAANFYSMRRFWTADHKFKMQVTAVHLVMITLLSILAIGDLRDLL